MVACRYRISLFILNLISHSFATLARKIHEEVETVFTKAVTNKKTWFADHETNSFSFLPYYWLQHHRKLMLMITTKSLMNAINVCCSLFWVFRKNFQRILQKQGMKFKLNTMVTSKLTLYVCWVRECFFESVNEQDVCSQ